MKVSEITVNDLAEYMKVSDTSQISMMLSSAKAYVKSYTGIDDTIMDTHEDITQAIFVLVAEMYDNRTLTVKNDKANIVVKSILNMYCTNLL